MKVMSFNIRYGTANDGENSWPFRRQAVLDFLATCGCDIVGMQEVLAFQLKEIQTAAPHLKWVGVGREDGQEQGEFAPILYDSRQFKLLSSGTFWFSDTPEVIASTSWGNELTRICTHASFEQDGKAFDVYNIHIDHESAPSRLKSVQLLAQRIRTTPTIVTGDFNEDEQEPAVLEMTAAGFTDTYPVANPKGPKRATYHGWTGDTQGPKIDYIFTKGAWTILESKILSESPTGRLLSDHYPVTATLSL